jgi:translation initiation factor IF-1
VDELRIGHHESEIANRESLMAEGVVEAQLPSSLYRVEIDGSRITAHIGGGIERNFIRLLVGDRVVVELTPRDLTRGRIVAKLQASGPGRRGSGSSGRKAQGGI